MEYTQTGQADIADSLLVERHGSVCVVTLNRPTSYNAADEALHADLAAVWPTLDADPSIHAVVLTGAGTAFSAGGDLALLDRMVRDEALRRRVLAEAGEIVRGLTSLGVPTVAAVNGPAVGLGCSLASMCDIVVVEDQAYFADPHVSLGLVAADGGALTWPLLMSLLRAKEFILLGERISAADAMQLGLANRVVATGESLSVAVGLAERLAKLPPQAVRETKALLNGALLSVVRQSLDESLALESASFDEKAFRDNLASLATAGRDGPSAKRRP